MSAHTHISFIFLTKYSGPHNYWVFHHNLVRFGRCGRCGKTRLHYFPSPTMGRGQRSLEENTAANTEEGSQDKSVLSLAGTYQLPSNCISYIATFSAKQKSPRGKWHRSIIWSGERTGVTQRWKCLPFHKITARDPVMVPSTSFSTSLVNTAGGTSNLFKTQVSFPEKESKVSRVYPLPSSK